jgi:hypothetical protein
MKEKYKTFDCEYMKISKDPRYLYIHLSTTHGWGIGGGKYMFLYDSITHELRCSIDDREITDIRFGIVKDSYKEIGSIKVEENVSIEDMFLLKEVPNKWYDAGSYSLFLMSGRRTKYLSIEKPELSSYPPFLWIIEQAEWIEKTHTIKRHGMKLRELIHSKFCHCHIPYRPTCGEKCIHCERLFHNYPSQSDNIVSLSLMTYIKLYDITDDCFHITINLDSKKCSCIKVSKDNVESEIQLSSSLTSILISQDKIDELLKGKWIKELENCLYDGNYYYYIIQQSKKFHRDTVACDFVEYWPLFASITKELYPFIEPRMMY